MVSRAVAVVLIGLLWLLPGGSDAHEERVVVGRVELIEATRQTLVVADAQTGERRRLTIDPETEVLACRSGASLTALHPGGVVRVKYLDRPGGVPGAQFILVLGGTP